MTYHLVFDKFPSPEGSRFIELEDSTGHSISAGEWRERKDGYVELILPAPAGWQDIATAPRDGTHILVSDRYCNQLVAYFSEGSSRWFGGGFTQHPTHWMPLPEAPK